MNYLVMEIHPAYAVVMDEEGRFLKAANLHYQVGDTVQNIVELRWPREKKTIPWKPLSSLASLVACLCLVIFGWYQPNFTPYGALRIQINPDVELTLSRTDRVLEVEGLNEDGEVLAAGYDYRGKDRETATEELVERAIDLGYLSDGDTVAITVTSSDADWQSKEEQAAQAELKERYGETIVIQVGPMVQEEPSQPEEIVIPVEPATETPQPVQPAQPPADDTDYAPASDDVTDYADTDYGPGSDGVTDYTPPASYSDGVTDYEDREDDDDDSDDDDNDDDDDDD